MRCRVVWNNWKRSGKGRGLVFTSVGAVLAVAAGSTVLTDLWFVSLFAESDCVWVDQEVQQGAFVCRSRDFCVCAAYLGVHSICYMLYSASCLFAY